MMYAEKTNEKSKVVSCSWKIKASAGIGPAECLLAKTLSEWIHSTQLSKILRYTNAWSSA